MAQHHYIQSEGFSSRGQEHRLQEKFHLSCHFTCLLWVRSLLLLKLKRISKNTCSNHTTETCCSFQQHKSRHSQLQLTFSHCCFITIHTFENLPKNSSFSLGPSENKAMTKPLLKSIFFTWWQNSITRYYASNSIISISSLQELQQPAYHQSPELLPSCSPGMAQTCWWSPGSALWLHLSSAGAAKTQS